MLVICGQGPAPAAASIDRFERLGLHMVPGSGLLPAVVPGAFDAWMRMLLEFGRLDLDEVMAPAVFYAEKGFPLAPDLPEEIAKHARRLGDLWPSSAAVLLPDGKAPPPNGLLRMSELARTYRRIFDEAHAASGGRTARIEAARRAWSQGFVAEAIDKFCAKNEVADIDGQRHRGLLTGEDMARWQATIEDPVVYDYQGHSVCKTGPWGQGPVFLQQLALLKDIDLANLDPVGAAFAHTVIEAAKLAFADREAYYGDPNFVEVPISGLLDDAYAEARRTLIADMSSYDLRPGEIEGHDAHFKAAAGARAAARAGFTNPRHAGTAGRPAGDTSYVAAADHEGNMVSATPSGGWFQSSPIIPGLGFCLNTRGESFWLERGLPASLAPGKRPRTTLSPTLVLSDGEPRLAFGSEGGDFQDQWSLAFFLRHVHHRMTLQEAIDAPAFHTTHVAASFYPRESHPGAVHLESSFPSKVAPNLAARGHRLTLEDGWPLARISAIARADGMLRAAANRRRKRDHATAR